VACGEEIPSESCPEIRGIWCCLFFVPHFLHTRTVNLKGLQREMISSPGPMAVQDRRHSERREFPNAINGRTEEENSEGSLILLTYSSDFDSAIRSSLKPLVGAEIKILRSAGCSFGSMAFGKRPLGRRTRISIQQLSFSSRNAATKSQRIG
jgi:hypothetical protein